ncbi:hypothetical protein [Massilia sp. CCM 8734]|uniref:hypothetical protein n=1 Tax=Massilia sp. CCM 8734 TaxID=2609283 RepID=UPI00142205D9|nr:hypothetical protein [Massilia sp. CCM 8734]NHZ98457.1 hypothetical protein [Massilia sp. CCM 8734]
MRRFFIIFMLLIFPLQVSWAVASAYCAHEPSSTISHPGHHEHGGDDHASHDNSPFGIDQDCGDCHFTSVGITTSTSGAIAPPPTAYAHAADAARPGTLRPVRPERPKWQGPA